MSNLRIYVFPFIDTVLNVIAAAVCICSTAKARFFHLLRGMCGCPNMKICRQTGNSYGLFSPNNTTGARSHTCVVILGKAGPLMKLALCWPGTGNTNFSADTSTLTTSRPHGQNKKWLIQNHLRKQQFCRNTADVVLWQIQSIKLVNHKNYKPPRPSARPWPKPENAWSRSAAAGVAFFLWQLCSLPSVCASHPFTTCYYSHQRLEQQPPPKGS